MGGILWTHQAGEDQKTGLREPRPTVLSEASEAMVIAFSRHTQLLLYVAILHLRSGTSSFASLFSGA